MAGETEIESRKSEYALRVPRIPRESIDVFSRDVNKGQYGMPAEVVSTVLEYVHLQRTLASFEDLTFSADFVTRLPENFRAKLHENVYPGIPLNKLEIPTIDKVFLAELLAADALTEALSREPIEVWITPDIQKKLEEWDIIADRGLQQLDYASLSLEAKRFIIKVLEVQEKQVHTILAARARFPEGIPAVRGFRALFSEKQENEQIIQFQTLEDLPTQYEAAISTLTNPLEVLLGHLIRQMREEKKERVVPPEDDSMFIEDRIRPRQKAELTPAFLEEEAKGNWWEWSEYKDIPFEAKKAIADMLRPRYENKTIFEILEADTEEKKHDILAAFWRRRGSKHIDLGDEGWIKNNLFLKKGGGLDLLVNDELYGNSRTTIAPRPLKHYQRVAMVDQALKWIQQETEALEKVRQVWKEQGYSETQIIESTFMIAITMSASESAKEQANALPDWFLDVLNQEVTFYKKLPLEFVPNPKLNDLLSFSMDPDPAPRNLLKEYFLRSRVNLMLYEGLLSSPEELFDVLGLSPTASDEQIKDAYRKIAKETQAIHINSPEEFEPEEWQNLNKRFIDATRAYKALVGRKMTDTRVTTLGKLRRYFEKD